MQEKQHTVGRFAPTPSGRMHLGNAFAALMAWLAVRSQGGTMLLRMEDLDTQRTKPEYAQLLRQDLQWLGLDWDTETPCQTNRTEAYIQCFEQLQAQNLLYPCYCTRSQLHSVNAPHTSDGTYVYPGTCRNLTPLRQASFDRAPAWRLKVPDRLYSVQDRIQGLYRENLAADCGDFVIRRGDGAFVYQLAVTVDDGQWGVNQVVRGVDLLSSVPRQMYLQELFGFPQPEYAHIPLLVAPDGRRLSKRDRDMDLGVLQSRLTAPHLIGILACAAGIIDRAEPVSPRELVGEFQFSKIHKDKICLKLSKTYDFL
ncbi:MAG: tRNA glutamyl-Q(34) synthetase GluQRS [Oscillospiraceae bacterium]|nr:tRNA glutamyl-Q(34) synthetase GluQRS [Oscillospiraceae bacterium]